MPQPKNEILVPLDESDFLAHCERQEQEIRKLKAALAEKDGQLDSLLAESIILARQKDELKEQIATLKATYRCFNCGFETTDKAEARAHFGDGEGEEAVCIHWYGMEDMEQATAYQEVLGELNQERDENVKLITENKQLEAAEKKAEEQIAALEAALKGKDDMRSWERYSGALEEHNKLLKGQIFVLRNEKYDLLEKLTALTTENASLKEKREIWEERNVQLETKCCALTAENKRLREALEKYANKNNYGTHHEENFLLELIHKGQGMANEINILVTENKQMMGQIAKLTTVSDGDPLHVLREMTEEQRLSFLRWSREGGKP